MGIFDEERIRKVATISTRFHRAADVGDEIAFGIMGDKEMPVTYRGSTRPTGTIVDIKNKGSENATLKVKMNDSGRMKIVHPYGVDPSRIWEFSEKSWPNVLERSRPRPQTYRGSAETLKGDEIATLRKEMSDMRTTFEKELAASRSFANALVASMGEVANEVSAASKDAKFCHAFKQEYKGMMERNGEKMASPFDSEVSDDDDF